MRFVESILLTKPVLLLNCFSFVYFYPKIYLVSEMGKWAAFFLRKRRETKKRRKRTQNVLFRLMISY